MYCDASVIIIIHQVTIVAITEKDQSRIIGTLDVSKNEKETTIVTHLILEK